MDDDKQIQWVSLKKLNYSLCALDKLFLLFEFLIDECEKNNLS